MGEGEYELTNEGYKILVALHPLIKCYEKEYKGKTYNELLDELCPRFESGRGRQKIQGVSPKG